MLFELNNKLFRQVIEAVIPTSCDFAWHFGPSGLMLSGRNSTLAVRITLRKVLFEKYTFDNNTTRSIYLPYLLAVLKNLDTNSTVFVDLNSAQKFSLRSNSKILCNEFIFPTVDPPDNDDLPFPGSL